jgi:hypothetical protein
VRFILSNIYYLSILNSFLEAPGLKKSWETQQN